MKHRTHRRTFLKNTAFAGIGVWTIAAGTPAEGRSPNEKLNIGIIGAGGRGASNTGDVATENIAALCDVNDQALEAAAKRFPQAKRYNDFREMLQQKDLDAVVVSTTDHTHAPASAMAMSLGKHVYCEKPLAHSVHEARRIQQIRNEKKVATQMGTQIHATENYRRVVELIQAGAIGPVREVHVWCNRVGLAPGAARPKDTPEVPKNIHWDLWLGPAPQRPYHPMYFGGCMVWEQRWDFGNGCLGDMGSHLIDLPFWALKLRQPKTAEAEGANRSDECYPQWLVAKWEHAETKDHPALTLTWHDGGKYPKSPPGHDLTKWGIGVLFIGDDGQLLADYGRCILLPEDKFKNFKPQVKTIPPSLGHHREWIHACKTGEPTLCNFDYSGVLVEHNLLGAVAFRVGRKISYDAATGKAIGCPEADPFLRREYRPGWTI